MQPLDADIFRQIANALSVGVYVVGLDRRIAFWNEAAEKFTGYLSQEVIGRPCHADIRIAGHKERQSVPARDVC
jgi:PAS domain S-box-containing protein